MGKDYIHVCKGTILTIKNIVQVKSMANHWNYKLHKYWENDYGLNIKNLIYQMLVRSVHQQYVFNHCSRIMKTIEATDYTNKVLLKWTNGQ